MSKGKWWQLEHPNLVEVKYRVVELPVNPLADLDAESVKAITALAHNPGFTALLAKLRLQRAALEAKLKQQHFDSIRDVDNIQAGIHWAEWLEKTVAKEVFQSENSTKKPRPAFDVEQREFERMAASLEVVGKRHE